VSSDGGDVCGYVWGQTNTRIDIPIKNKDRQTYFGALDQTQNLSFRSIHVEFINYKFIDLQAQRPGKKLLLIWDGAGYHKSDEIKEFLASVNDNHQP